MLRKSTDEDISNEELETIINPFYDNYHNYVEEYLKNNVGKKVEVHVSFSDSIEWRDTIFKGILEETGKDFIVVNNDNKKYVIWSIYIDYIIIN